VQDSDVVYFVERSFATLTLVAQIYPVRVFETVTSQGAACVAATCGMQCLMA
jgi:hypothetical protein